MYLAGEDKDIANRRGIYYIGGFICGQIPETRISFEVEKTCY